MLGQQVPDEPDQAVHLFPALADHEDLDGDWRDLEAEDRLQPVEDPVFGRRVHRQYRNLARKLRRNLRREVERGALLEWVGIEALLESLEVVSMACETVRIPAKLNSHSC